MAGLGAGAGAFEGQRHRDQMAMERARLAEQQHQFDVNARARDKESTLAREERAGVRAEAQANREIDREDRLDQQSWQREQRERDIDLRQQDREDRLDQQDWQREQAEQKASWDAIINQDKLETQRKQREVYQANLDRATALFKQEQEALAQRKFITQTQVAVALTMMRQNNGAVPASHLPALSEVIGADVQGAWDDQNGNLVIAVTTGEQDEAGNPVVVQNPIPIADIEKFMESVVGVRQYQAAFEQAVALKGRGRASVGQQSGEGEIDEGAQLRSEYDYHMDMAKKAKSTEDTDATEYHQGQAARIRKQMSPDAPDPNTAAAFVGRARGGSGISAKPERKRLAAKEGDSEEVAGWIDRYNDIDAKMEQVEQLLSNATTEEDRLMASDYLESAKKRKLQIQEQVSRARQGLAPKMGDDASVEDIQRRLREVREQVGSERSEARRRALWREENELIKQLKKTKKAAK